MQEHWQKNYRKVGVGLSGSRLRIGGANVIVDAQSFVENPDWMLDPTVAYWIASAGMRHG